ncbi:hypothetical protein SPRG_19489 [Saprolegnia parasitica CBS 223.65]|uniref:Uncharacterized protein n=1 Tax=Saprolegnia parasitica (strain CBS 223.65) TaxID=695850 RepID=A0A067D0E3_SAPPC|nr:hypothetical protein SPRG_19489 [Saprolegnia parasitica CBS 223.65]KDO32211.1 hypothetical protein SPRG_19489 [Saprolegnia parasitica CBS 223.65]|eukprot:XP_012197414.1 hypothetical protein SPRG_19489 [Saprolegnia parasitica CBS 223.65]
MTPDEQAIVLEIAQDPSMLAFHEDDAAVCELLRSICRLVDDVIASASEPVRVESETTPLEAPLTAAMPTATSPPGTEPLLAVATPAGVTETNDAVPVVELKRIKFTQKLMKRVMNDDELMGLMAEPVVTEFFEEFSEDMSKTPTITFAGHETAVIAFYKRLLQLSGVHF